MAYDARTAIEQIEKCGFECVAGPLRLNTGYQFLADHLAKGPRYLPGQRV